MTEPLSGRRIVLGVSGSIAAYKALTLASRMATAGAEVDVILTRAAAELVRPLAFRALTHRPVVSNLWDPVGPMALDHISIARSADLLLVAPATAHVIARLALGLADDALTTTALATRAPLVVAPAMEPNMWSHSATRGHVRTLQDRGAVFVGPEEGRMASGQTGRGRLAEPEVVLEHARIVLAKAGDLAGRHIVVSAGPTREPVDPVRFLSNRSSGQMGFAVAVAARNRGARVVLVSGPVAFPPPAGIELVPVETAVEMRDAVLARAMDAHALIMTAAVADYRPADYSTSKLKKADDDLAMALTRNPDVLLELRAKLVGDRLPVRVGFAAETDDLVANARAKLERKGLDLIVANAVPASFGGDSARAALIDDGGVVELDLLTKTALADEILDRVAARLLALEDAPLTAP